MLSRLLDAEQAVVATVRREMEQYTARRRLKAALLRAEQAELRADIAEREARKLAEIIRQFCRFVDELGMTAGVR